MAAANPNTPLNQTAPPPADRLNMNVSESESKVEDPQNNEDVYLGSFASILHNNIGAYVICEFLIGTEQLVAKAGYLYNSGINFMTLYNEDEDYYIVCDLYSVKFVNFFEPGKRPRYRQQMNGGAVESNRAASVGVPPTMVNTIPTPNNIAIPGQQQGYAQQNYQQQPYYGQSYPQGR